MNHYLAGEMNRLHIQDIHDRARRDHLARAARAPSSKGHGPLERRTYRAFVVVATAALLIALASTVAFAFPMGPGTDRSGTGGFGVTQPKVVACSPHGLLVSAQYCRHTGIAGALQPVEEPSTVSESPSAPVTSNYPVVLVSLAMLAATGAAVATVMRYRHVAA
jgi:hypothetical protein